MADAISMMPTLSLNQVQLLLVKRSLFLQLSTAEEVHIVNISCFNHSTL